MFSGVPDKEKEEHVQANLSRPRFVRLLFVARGSK